MSILFMTPLSFTKIAFAYQSESKKGGTVPLKN